MKRTHIFGVCLLVLWLFVTCVCPVSAETPADAARTLVWNGSALTSEDQTAAFWEYPQLTAGQTRRNGGLTLINHSLGPVKVALDSVQFPYDNEEALTYLNALHLTIRDGDQVLYDGAFSRLGDDGLAQPVGIGHFAQHGAQAPSESSVFFAHKALSPLCSSTSAARCI